jgi:raffinose/stachyose/melibiose transport system substrate-binding protein
MEDPIMGLNRAFNRFVASLAVGAALGAGFASAQELKVWALTFGDGEAKVNEAWVDIAKSFEVANPGVKVSLVTRSVDEHKVALRVAARSEQGPDIYFMWAGPGLGGEFVKAGLSKPMDAYYKKYDWDNRLTGASLGYSRIYPGGRQGVPYTFHGEAVYYNKALFTKAGIAAPPASYAELKGDAAKLKAAGIPAFTFGGSANWHLMRLMDAILETKCGADKHDALKSLKADWGTDPAVTESFKELHDWTANYILSPFMGIDQPQSFNLFLANRAAMMLEGDWLVGQLREQKRQNDFAIFPIPTGTGRLYSFAEYYYVSTRSKAPDMAAKFLDHLLSDGVQQKYLGVLGAISVNKNVKYAALEPIEQSWRDLFARFNRTYVNGDQALPLDVTTEYFRIINGVASNTIAPENAGKLMQTFINNRK